MSQRLLCRVLFRLLSLAAVFVTIGGRSAYARQCNWIGTALPGVLGVETVFIGTVRKIAAEAGSSRRATFDVEQVERGAERPDDDGPGPAIEFLIGRSPFAVGGRYVVYALRHGR